MQFSPRTRAILTAVVAALAVVAVSLPALGAPLWVGIVLGAIVAGLGAVGIVPPQTGGTQVGGMKAELTSPPHVETPGPADGVVIEQLAPGVEPHHPKFDQQHGLGDGPAVPRKRGSEQDGLF
jgi:hypothetical protein